MGVFPGSIPSFAGFVSTHTLAQDTHAAQHNLEQSEISAIATKVGTGASTPIANRVLAGDGVGTSSWSQVNLTNTVTGVLPQANGGTGTTSATGTGAVVYQTSPTINTPVITNPTLTTDTVSEFTSAAGVTIDGLNIKDSKLNTNDSVVTANITADAVTDAKLVYGKLRSRQGGSATNWQTTGTTTYDYSATNTFIQVGSAITSTGVVTVTFPTAFNQVPIVLAGVSSAVSANVYVRIDPAPTATQFTATIITDAGGLGAAETINWIAIGE